MPVPKGKQKLYGKIVGRHINEGKSMDEAKGIADKVVEVLPTKRKNSTTPPISGKPKTSFRKNGKKKEK